jgi:hypothetical protein
MKKVFLFPMIVWIIIIFSACRTGSKPAVVNAFDFGIDTVKDATPVILKALEVCKKKKATKLIIPKGRYDFYRMGALEEFMSISNNDQGLKRLAFPLKGFQSFEIDGQGSEFIFHGYMIPFDIEDCRNILIRNLSIDWIRPFHSQGKVVAVNPLTKTFDITIAPEYPYTIEGQELIFVGEGWKQNIEKNLFFDTLRKSTVYDVTRYKLDPWNPLLHTRYGAKELAKGLVRITDTIAVLPKVGWIWVSKGGKEPDRQSPAFRIFNSFGVTFKNIAVYHSGAMGFIAEHSGDIILDSTRVMLRPGSGRFVSSTADATHFVGCKGSITLSNCLFENMLDDATNVHGVYATLKDCPDRNTIGVNLKHFQQWGFTFATPGDSIRLVNKETMIPYKTLRVVEVVKVNEEYLQLRFNENISEIVKPNTGLENISWYPNFTMKNCIVRQNRARSILISTPGKVLIEGNKFSSMMAGILISGDVNFWYESGPVTNVVIRKNEFVDCCTSGQNQAVILIDPNILKIDSCGNYYHRNIIIEDNIFRAFDRPVLTAKSVDGLTFRNNTIEQTYTFEPFYPEKGTINLEYIKNCLIQGNFYKGKSPAGISCKLQTINGLIVKDNKGFK